MSSNNFITYPIMKTKGVLMNCCVNVILYLFLAMRMKKMTPKRISPLVITLSALWGGPISTGLTLLRTERRIAPKKVKTRGKKEIIFDVIFFIGEN